MGIAGLNYKYTRKFGHGKIRIVLSMKIKSDTGILENKFFAPELSTKKGI